MVALDRLGKGVLCHYDYYDNYYARLQVDYDNDGMDPKELDEEQQSRHKTRPIHPECARLSNPYAACSCESLWGYETDLRKLYRAQRVLDMRTKHARHGGPLWHGPDSDEPTSGFTAHSSLHEPALSNDLEASGFWKESEFLKQFVEKDLDNEE